jgi:hypothetical protein
MPFSATLNASNGIYFNNYVHTMFSRKELGPAFAITWKLISLAQIV